MSYLYSGGNQEENTDYNHYNEEERNDIPPDGLDPSFCENVQNLKWNIYQHIILKPELETSGAQDNTLLKKYVNNIRQIYVLSLNAKKGYNKNINLHKFPKEVREEIQELLDWIATFFKKNQPYQTIPYSDYLMTSFQVYPFIQRKSFED
jgi:hypothetical protein